MEEETSSIGWTEQIRKVRITEVEKDYESGEIDGVFNAKNRLNF